MSFQRTVFVAFATLFTLGMTSLASACCGDWGYAAPIAYAPVAVAPVAVAPVPWGGCGGCGAPTAAAVYAQPVAPVPVAPAPIAVGSWGGGCCGGSWGGSWGGGSWGGGSWGGSWGGGCGGCGAVAWGGPSPLYVVNQGPAYTGPGLMVPYGTYTPDTAYAPATNYPYVPAYGSAQPAYNPYFEHLYYRPRYAYRGPAYIRARYYAPGPRMYGYHRHWHQW
jgi:hypothetical protein